MDYVALRFVVGADAADAWSDALLAAGALSVDASDPRAGTPDEVAIYAEPGAEADALWPATRLTALFEADDAADRALVRAAATLGLTAPPHEILMMPEQDWVRATQRQFEPIRIAERFWVVPSWCAAPDPLALNLSLDPGVAFGTGSHPTTRLCLLWLRAHVKAGDAVLDYGCGSGILAIAAAKLGAARVVGTDVDAQALAASADNARANEADASFVAPDALGDNAFDIVVANILTNALLLLAPVIASRVRSGGRVALCGILTPQADTVIDMYRRWFDIETWQSFEDWSLLAGVRVAQRDGRAV